MNIAVITIGIIVVFISVFTALGTLGSMAAKYNECRDHMFSETEQCSLTAFGKNLSTGIIIVSIASIIAVATAYIALGAGRQKRQYQYSRFG